MSGSDSAAKKATQFIDNNNINNNISNNNNNNNNSSCSSCQVAALCIDKNDGDLGGLDPIAENEREAFVKFKAHVASQPTQFTCKELEQNILDATIRVNDATLIRFLRARDLDLILASEMLLKHLKWRDEVMPSLLTRTDVSKGLEMNCLIPIGTSRQGFPILLIKAKNFVPSKLGVRETETAKAKKNKKKKGEQEEEAEVTSMSSGVVPGELESWLAFVGEIVVRMGQNHSVLRKVSVESLRKKSNKTKEPEAVSPEAVSCGTCGGALDTETPSNTATGTSSPTGIKSNDNAGGTSLVGREKIVFLIDLKSFSFSSHWSPLGISRLKRALELAQGHFPERLHACVFFNPPMVFKTAWYVISRWLQPDTLLKVFIANSKENKKRLFDLVDPSEVPVIYGGTRTIPVQPL